MPSTQRALVAQLGAQISKEGVLQEKLAQALAELKAGREREEEALRSSHELAYVNKKLQQELEAAQVSS